MTKLRLTIINFFVAISLLVTSGAIVAQQSSPVAMLEQLTNQMLSALAQTKDRNPQTLYNLVRNILLPHSNLDLMSQQVIGKYWAQATPEQRADFQKQFTYFMTRTYSTALSSYSNEKVRYFPIRGATGNRVQVNSEIDQASGQSVAVSYRLARDGNQWKIYDFSVEGVSLIDNYRAQFADVLRTQGLEGLNQRLKARNSGQ